MYGKLFEQTFTGSMAGSGACVFAVWSYVVAHAKKGTVEINATILAAQIGEPPEKIRTAIEFLCSPDPNSRTKTNEGRRLIQAGEFLYDVPNHAHYRAILNDDERREYNRVKQQESRARKSKKTKGQKKSKRRSMTVIDKSALSAHAEAESESESEKTLARARARRVVEELPQDWPERAVLVAELDHQAWAEWCRHRRKIGKRVRNIEAAQKRLVKGRDAAAQRAAVEHSAGGDYQGIYDPRLAAGATTNGASAKAWSEILANHGTTSDPIGIQALRDIGGWRLVGFENQSRLPYFATQFHSAYKALTEKVTP